MTTIGTPSTLTIRSLAATIGAELGGVDLSQELSDETIAEIRQTLLDWKVVFFRDQDITTEQHLAFGRRFGDLEVHPFASEKPGYPEVLALTHDNDNPGRENVWHSDVTWRQEPSLGSILRNLESPEIGGDTLFADMYAAYDGLPRRIKDRVDGQVARHDFEVFRRTLKPEKQAEFDALYPHPHHPVIRTHPETGRKAIYVNQVFTREIVGMDPDESAELLDILYRQAAYPEYQVRFTWEANSIAFWDNRACQHYAVSDYWPAARRVERVTVAGDKPYYAADEQPEDAAERPFKGTLERWARS